MVLRTPMSKDGPEMPARSPFLSPVAAVALALLAACAPTHPPAMDHTVVAEMPEGGPARMGPAGGAVAGAWVPTRTDGHPTHAAPVYETAAGCTGFNTAYAMTAEVAHRWCEDMYVAGQVPTYRAPVYHDALGRAHAPNRQGMWTRSVPHDRYVIGDQPHR